MLSTQKVDLKDPRERDGCSLGGPATLGTGYDLSSVKLDLLTVRALSPHPPSTCLRLVLARVDPLHRQLAAEGFAKLIERCSDGVEDQGAEEGAWGQE